MTPGTALQLIIDPTLRYLGFPYSSDRARLLLLTIGLHESQFRYRQQIGGPARGFWQFELTGGCTEFATAKRCGFFRNAARNLQFPTEAAATWAMIGNGADVLACLMARAVLWLDPASLPDLGDETTAWRYYLRRWRPKLRPATPTAQWQKNYTLALTTLGGSPDAG